MNIDKEIKKVEKKLAALKAKSLKTQARRKKTALSRVMATVKKFGFDTIQELLEVADTAAISTAHLPKKRKRAKVTEPLRKSIIAMLKAGKTVAVTAERHKISTATVNNIKKAAGLTKSKKAVKKVAPKKKRTAKKVKLPELQSPTAPSTVT